MINWISSFTIIIHLHRITKTSNYIECKPCRRFLDHLLGAIHGTMARCCSDTCRRTLRCRRLHRGAAVRWLCSVGLLHRRCRHLARHRRRRSCASMSSGRMALEDGRSVAPTSRSSSSAGASTSRRMKRWRRSNGFGDKWGRRWGAICRWRKLGRFHGGAGRRPPSPAGSLLATKMAPSPRVFPPANAKSCLFPLTSIRYCIHVLALRFVLDAQDLATVKVAVTIAIAPDLGPQEPRRWALNLKAVTALNRLKR